MGTREGQGEAVWAGPTRAGCRAESAGTCGEAVRPLVVTKLDRLARSVAHLGQIVDGLERRKVGLRVLDLGLDTSTATGQLMLNVLGSVAQFERAMMLERQRDGIAKARAEGRYKGRAPTAMRQAERIRVMAAEGMTRKTIAAALGVSERSVYRALR